MDSRAARRSATSLRTHRSTWPRHWRAAPSFRGSTRRPRSMTTAPTRRAPALRPSSTARRGKRIRSGRGSTRRCSTAPIRSTCSAGTRRRAATARSGTCTSPPGARPPSRRKGTSARRTTATSRVSRATGSSRRPTARRSHVDFLADAVADRVVRGGPARRVAGDVPDDAVVALDRLLEPPVHLGLAPVLHALVLDPLVVRDGDAAGIADDVRDELDPAFRQHPVSLGGGGSVGAFRHQLYFETLRYGSGDLAAERGRDEDVRLDVPQIVLPDLLRLRIAGDRATQVRWVLVHVRDEIGNVDAVRVVDGAAGIVDREEPPSERLEDLRRVRSDVAESLQHERRARGDRAAIGEPLLDGVREALSRGAHAAFGTADARVLAGDDAAQAMPLALAVRVLSEQEAHHVGIRSDVRRRDVEVRADQRLQPVHVAERQRLELLAGERLRIDLDAALAPAEGDVGDRGLPGHLRGEHLEEVQRDVLVEADAAFVGAARLVVLDPVGLEALRAAGEDLVEALVLEAHDAVAHEHVGVDEGAALEDEATVEERLEAVGEQLAVAQVLVLLLLVFRQRQEPRVKLHRDVEDVLVVGLLELHPYPAVEADEIGGPMEDLHRLGVDGGTPVLVGCCSRGQSASRAFAGGLLLGLNAAPCQRFAPSERT